jgi:hypothetical protein
MRAKGTPRSLVRGNMTVIHLCSDWTASAFIYYGFHVEGKKRRNAVQRALLFFISSVFTQRINKPFKGARE